MYSRNLFNFLKPALPKGELVVDWKDEVFAGAVLTHEGEIKHEATRKSVEGQSKHDRWCDSALHLHAGGVHRL